MANKKISELPLISLLSGSTNATTTALNTVVPVVMYGTTNQITVENFSKLVTAYNATTASNHFKGSQFITGSLVVTGDITAERYYIETITSSVIYESGSTVFGNSGDDIHTFTGSIILNGSTIGFSQLNAQTASQDLVNRGISSVTGSINTTTSSFDNVFLGISSVTGAMNTTTSSFDNVFLGISSVTGSINAQSSSQDLVNRGISSVTGSINTTTSSFNSVFLGISSVTGAMNTQSSSQNLVNLSISTYTGSQNIINTSVDAHILKQAIQTGSQDLVNLGISSVTGSLIGITNGLMAFTAALDSTYATDAQLYQLYQATSSIHSTTQSLNTFTGSIQSEIAGIEAYTASLKSVALVSGSLIASSSYSVVSDGARTIDIFTTNTNVDAYPLFTNVIGTTGVSVLGDNNLRYNAFSNTLTLTGTISATTYLGDIVSSSAQIGEIAGLQAYTQSLKAVAIVSSSTQISNYYKFAETASANTFYGNQKVKGNLDIDNKVSISGSLIVSTSINQLWATPEFQLYNGLGNVNFALTPKTGNQFTIQAYGTKAELLQANEPLRLLSPELQFVKYDNNPTLVSITGSVDVKSGGIKVRGNLDVDNKVSVTGSLIVSSSANQLWATPEFQLYNGLGTVNLALTPNTGNQLQIQAYGTKAEITQANEPLRLLTPTLQMVKYDNTPTKVEVTGSANITGSLTINSGSITMPNRPAFRVVGNASTDRTGTYTLSGSNFTVDYNEGNHFNTTNGKFTAPLAGLYNVYYNGRVGSVNAQQQVIIYKNGPTGVAQLMWESAGNTGATHFGVSGITKLAAGDTLEAMVTIGSIQFDANDNFGATYIG